MAIVSATSGRKPYHLPILLQTNAEHNKEGKAHLLKEGKYVIHDNGCQAYQFEEVYA
eukprot:c14441_g2_i1 orf=1-168(-)